MYTGTQARGEGRITNNWQRARRHAPNTVHAPRELQRGPNRLELLYPHETQPGTVRGRGFSGGEAFFVGWNRRGLILGMRGRWWQVYSQHPKSHRVLLNWQAIMFDDMQRAAVRYLAHITPLMAENTNIRKLDPL
jgi:hypothetical protein